MLLICKNSAILISVMELNYKGKTAFVSGAGRGIGKAVALELAKAGCTVLCISKNISSIYARFNSKLIPFVMF